MHYFLNCELDQGKDFTKSQFKHIQRIVTLSEKTEKVYHLSH
jgi:hypothetical protein